MSVLTRVRNFQKLQLRTSSSPISSEFPSTLVTLLQSCDFCGPFAVQNTIFCYEDALNFKILKQLKIVYCLKQGEFWYCIVCSKSKFLFDELTKNEKWTIIGTNLLRNDRNTVRNERLQMRNNRWFGLLKGCLNRAPQLLIQKEHTVTRFDFERFFTESPHLLTNFV